MPESARASEPATTSQRLIGDGETHLSIGTHDGELNAGTYNEWIEAMRGRQALQKRFTEWVAAVAEMGKVCRGWLRLNEKWVREIAVRFNSEPASVSLYVVVKEPEKLTLEQRCSVAEMGLLLGGAFGIRAEARVTGARPQDHTFIMD